MGVMNIHQGTPYATGSYAGLNQAATTLYLVLRFYSVQRERDAGLGPGAVHPRER